MDSKLVLTIQSIFKGEGFTKATQATKNMSKDIKGAGEAVKDLAGSMGQLGGEVGRVAGGLGKLLGMLGAGPIGILVAGITAVVGAFMKWRNTMREVQQSMNELARSRHEDLWSRLHKRIADAAKAQADFFDEAISKGQRLIAMGKQERAARAKAQEADRSGIVEEIRQRQASADAELARKKRENLSNPNMTRTEADYLNQQLDLDNQKQHIDTERRIATQTHKMKMEASQNQMKELQKEKETLEKEAQTLYDKDESLRRTSQARKKALLQEAQDLENNAEYAQLRKRTRRREEQGYETSTNANRRQRYWDDLRKVDEWNKRIADKREEAAKIDDEVAKQSQDIVKRQQEINSRLNVISSEFDYLGKHIDTQNKAFVTQTKALDAKYHDTWSKIEQAARERSARQTMKRVERDNAAFDLQIRDQSSRWQTGEFKDLVKASLNLQKIQNALDTLSKAEDPITKGRRLIDSNPELKEKLTQQLSDAQRDFTDAYRKAVEKRDALGAGILDQAQRNDRGNLARGREEQSELLSKMQSGEYTSSQVDAMKREFNSIQNVLQRAQRDLLRAAEARAKLSKDGIEKQAALADQLDMIRQIEDNNKDTLRNIENNTRQRERNDLTGEGRKRRRNEEKDRNEENQRLERRIRAQDKAAQRDADKGWGLDANGNLVRTRGIASGTLSTRQKQRLQEYLQRKRLEDEQKRLGKQEDNVQRQIKNNLGNMLRKLNDVDRHLIQALSCP